MSDLLNQAAAAAKRYLERVDAREVWPCQDSVDRLAEFREPLPAGPTSPEAVIEMLDRVGSPATVATTGGRFFGFVVGGALPVAVAANWLASAWDQNAVSFVTSPLASAIEEVASGWLLELLHLPAECGTGFVTGATMASFTALAAARSAVLERAGWDVEANGLTGAPSLTLVVSEEVHPSVTKALGLLGLGRSKAFVVPVDGQGRMRVDWLPDLRGPAIVCTQAGNVNTGAIDPIGEICTIAHESAAWMHVDGAFGLWAAACPSRAHLAAGIGSADSWATDAHKWLNVLFDSGLAFVRSASHLNRAMSLTAAYLPQGTRRDPAQFVPELSRCARAIDIWAVLRSLGRSGVAEMIDRTCRHAARFAESLKAAGCEILNDVVLNQVLVSFGDPETTRRVIERIQQDGTCWCGGTTWQGRTAMRISVSSWATTEEDVERSLESMIRAKREVERGGLRHADASEPAPSSGSA